MKPSGGYAVMAQKHDRNDFLEDYPTPPWAVRALCEHVIKPIRPAYPLERQTCWEPACNRGFMARPLAEYFKAVHATDIHDYGWDGQKAVRDFLIPMAGDERYDWVISNPPFRLASQFINRALDVSRGAVAMLVRTSFLESVDRYETLFKDTPPAIIAQFVERVPMVKGRHDPAASTATSYAWLVWCWGVEPTKFVWIPPCRRQLQKPGDACPPPPPPEPRNE